MIWKYQKSQKWTFKIHEIYEFLDENFLFTKKNWNFQIAQHFHSKLTFVSPKWTIMGLKLVILDGKLTYFLY